MSRDEVHEEHIDAKLVQVNPRTELVGQASIRFSLPAHSKGERAVQIAFYPEETDLVALDGMTSGWGPYELLAEGHNFGPVYVSQRTFHPMHVPRMVLDCMCFGFELGDATQADTLIFLIPDLIIGYDGWVTHKRGRKSSSTRTRSQWTITLSGHAVPCDIHGLSIGFEASQGAHAGRVTVGIGVPFAKVEGLSVDAVVERFDDILWGISLATGRPRRWAKIKAVRGRRVVWQRFREPLHSPHEAGVRMLYCELGGVVSGFVAAYSRWVDSLSQDRRAAIKTLIWGLLEATCHRVFPAPLLVLSCSLETFIAQYCDYKASCYLPRETRRRLLPSFELWEKNNVVPQLCPGDRDQFSEKTSDSFSQYLQRRLNERLTNLLTDIESPNKEETIRRFVSRRNAAAHKDYEFDPNDWEITKSMARLLHKFILHEVGYGPPQLSLGMPDA